MHARLTPKTPSIHEEIEMEARASTSKSGPDTKDAVPPDGKETAPVPALGKFYDLQPRNIAPRGSANPKNAARPGKLSNSNGQHFTDAGWSSFTATPGQFKSKDKIPQFPHSDGIERAEAFAKRFDTHPDAVLTGLPDINERPGHSRLKKFAAAITLTKAPKANQLMNRDPGYHRAAGPMPSKGAAGIPAEGAEAIKTLLETETGRLGELQGKYEAASNAVDGAAAGARGSAACARGGTGESRESAESADGRWCAGG
ncbi:MAG: hypothetical protein WDN30_05375 [Pararobbsia sp.]